MGFVWKDAFGTIAAFIGLISACVTALGTIITYKLKKSEKTAAATGAVKILSLKERRSRDWNREIVKYGAYFGLIFIPLMTILMWWFEVEGWFIALFALILAPIGAFNLYMHSKLRGDISKKSSRTKYDTTVTLQAPYDVVFAKCNEAVLRRKAKIILLDFENGIIESERVSLWHVPFKLNVKISRIDDDRCSVHVESDATLPTVLFDFGMNARRVNRFLRDLLQ